MDLGLRGAAVLVAGSSAGIGLATARRFYHEGASVLLTGRRRDRLVSARDALAAEGSPDARVEQFNGDMTEPAAVDACLAHAGATFGALDVVVANVGSGRVTPGWDADQTAWETALQQNLFGAVALVRAAVPLMAGRGGSVVLIGSIAGIEAMRAPIAYRAAKAALHAFGKGLADELAPRGIRANVVAPGNVWFPGGRWEEIERADPEGTARYIRESVPLQRFGEPDEVAAVAVFLSSRAASFVTGACVVVDGGQTRRV